MDRDLVALLGFVAMFGLMALRVPIGVAMGIAGVGGFAALTSQPTVPTHACAGFDSHANRAGGKHFASVSFVLLFKKFPTGH